MMRNQMIAIPKTPQSARNTKPVMLLILILTLPIQVLILILPERANINGFLKTVTNTALFSDIQKKRLK